MARHADAVKAYSQFPELIPMRHFLVALVLAASLHVTAQADLIAKYDFTGLDGPTPSVTGTPGAGVTLSTLTRSGVDAAPAADGFNSSGWTTDTSPDLDQYLTFTINPSFGPLSLTRISFNERRSPPQGVRTFEIRSSFDNYLAAIPGTVTQILDDLPGAREQSYALSFVNLVSPITFRIYGYNSEEADETWRLENYTGNVGATGGLTVEGIAAVPEPGAFLFGGLVCGVIGLGFGGRRLWALKSGS